jgi:hypothetical protein
MKIFLSFLMAPRVTKWSPNPIMGDKTNLNNYRPIPLLPVISKVFETVIIN